MYGDDVFFSVGAERWASFRHGVVMFAYALKVGLAFPIMIADDGLDRVACKMGSWASRCSQVLTCFFKEEISE